MKHLFLAALFLGSLAALGKESQEVAIRAADYKVSSVDGVFGIYGIIKKEDVLRFDPNTLLEKAPDSLKFVTGDKREGPSYLDIPGFRLERVLYDKGPIVGYSFFCRQGAQGSSESRLRFDLRVDWGKMFVVYESQGIIHGVIVLERIEPKTSEQGAASKP